jgi:transcriptional regulator with PAS, ATPase and Fis domain
VDLQQENRLLRDQLQAQVAFGSLVGASEKMLRVYRMVEKVSSRNYSVLILGESGTGKELIARAVHFASPRKNQPFVPVDGSAITPTLIESELFGYVKGAFTGAVQTKRRLPFIAKPFRLEEFSEKVAAVVNQALPASSLQPQADDLSLKNLHGHG